ncbi:MAG: hypothetical protein IPJ37_18020 [Bacteroidales bacterium]|nr:hypothetical protein [Bacteroidales bacterium]
MKSITFLFIMTGLFLCSCDKENNITPSENQIGELKIENLITLDSDIPADFYNDLTFTDENTGYAISRNGKIVKTVDAGETWTLLNSTVSFYLNRIQFINDSIGYVIGGDTGGSYLLKTKNAGQSWSVKNLESTENLYPTGMFFKNENEGYITGFRLFIKTINGGESWSAVLASTNENFSDVKFKDNNIGIATINTSDYYKTTNAGVSWQIMKSDNLNNLSKIYFVGGKTLIKSGNKLVDVAAGKTITIPDPAEKLLFLNENKCIGIGQHYESGFFPYGDILLTNNNWSSFLQKSYPPYTELMDISAIAKINNHRTMIIGRGASKTKIILLSY